MAGTKTTMKKRGYARKRDANEAEIVAALERVGATVAELDKPVDLVVGYRGVNFLLEVKNGNQPPSWQRMTEDQQRFFDTWQGRAAVVRNVDEALEAIGASSGTGARGVRVPR